jgi:hypothetical protein
LQFSIHTVIGYQLRKDGRRFSLQEAVKLAHDYDRSAELAKYIIFDLEEPWHWPHCAKKISLRSEITTVRELISQALVADANANDASVEMGETETVKPESKSRRDAGPSLARGCAEAQGHSKAPCEVVLQRYP